MKVVLRSDVADLGKKGDIADVAPGYARNFLIPRGLAMRSTLGAEGQAATMQKARMERDTANREAAQAIATKLVPTVINMMAKAGDGGRLFGSITSAQVSTAVMEQAGLEISSNEIDMGEPIKEIGAHMVTAKLHADVQFPISLNIQPE